jgi:ankyrin repeat protein
MAFVSIIFPIRWLPLLTLRCSWVRQDRPKVSSSCQFEPIVSKIYSSSTIIDNVETHFMSDRNSRVIYYYFDFNDKKKQDLENLLRSLIVQLSSQSTRPSKALADLYAKSRNGAEPAKLLDLQDALNKMLMEGGQIYILLDALDECTEISSLLNWLDEIVKRYFGQLHLLATSRKYRDIEVMFIDIGACGIDITNEDIYSDIGLFIKDQLGSRIGFKRWKADIKNEITDALKKGARGMYCFLIFLSRFTALIGSRFRWVVCQLDVLEGCLTKNTFRSALASLPRTLDETYKRALLSIKEEHQEDAFRILQWLTFSVRPLKVNEIAEIVAAKPDNDSKFEEDDRLANPDDIIMYCGTLVTTQESREWTFKGRKAVSMDKKELRLAHFSVKEYLVSPRILDHCRQYSIREIDAHLSIASTCLTYLLHVADLSSMPENVVAEYPLAKYAAGSWYKHVRKSGAEMEPRNIDRRVVRFLDNEKLRVMWIQLDGSNKWGRERLGTAAPLYWTSFLGLLAPTQLFLTAGANVNAKSRSHYGTALQAASGRGHGAIVTQLLEAGANVNAESGGHYGTALQAASDNGHEAISTQLLEAGADVNVESGGFYRTALQAASGRGRRAIVMQLLGAGANVNAESGGHYSTALQAASGGGHKAIVMQLLEAGADVNAESGGLYGTALQAASHRGHEAIMMQLLEAGADVNAESRDSHSTALQEASAGGHRAIVTQLLDAGADVNINGGIYSTALQAASAGGHEAIVSRLLDAGADVNVKGGQYGTALRVARVYHHSAIEQRLLEAGAEEVESPASNSSRE